MAVPDWYTDESWDTLFLGGVQVPGVVKVNVKLGSGLDIQKPKGWKKATIKDDGAPPIELSIRVEMNAGELINFQEDIIPLIRTRSKKGARDPLEIEHPQAQLWGVDVVTIGDIDAPTPEEGGSYILTMQAIEWYPAPVEPKKPSENPKGKEKDVQTWRDFAADAPVIAEENL